MRIKVLFFTVAAFIAGPSIGVAVAPLAHAYPNCAAARAAGAAPLYRGQPGYSAKLDRDGDGVACETGSSGRSPGQPVPAPLIPSPAVPQPVSTPIPAPTAQPNGSGGAYETVVNWTGTDCIDITAPDSSPARVLATSNHCGGTARFSQEASDSQMVGADPIMGAAESITCEILTGRLRDSGTRGDGHDVNCLTRADSLKASA